MLRTTMFRSSLRNLPPSSLKVMKLLHKESPLTQKELVNQSKMSSKTVRYGITKLKKAGFISFIPNLEDMRTSFIKLNKELNKEELQELEKLDGI